MTATQAAAYLGVSTRKLGSLLKDKVIAYSVDPLDKRRRLLNVSDLDELKMKSLGKAGRARLARGKA